MVNIDRKAYNRCLQGIMEGRVDEVIALHYKIVNGTESMDEWCAETFLCYASAFENLEAIRFLVERCGVRNSENYITCATIAGSIETIALLQSYGAIVGYSAFYNAMCYRHTKVLEHLYKSNATHR